MLERRSKKRVMIAMGGCEKGEGLEVAAEDETRGLHVAGELDLIRSSVTIGRAWHPLCIDPDP